MSPDRRNPPASWSRRTILITAGPTREYLDPIRFLSNGSTGSMGFALAREASRRGARVILVCGPVPVPKFSSRVSVVSVVSALDMRRETLRRCAGTDAVIAAAAVGDWRFKRVSRTKIKRSASSLRLTLVPNPDIIAEVARRVRKGPAVSRPTALVGFALETSMLLKNAAGKMKKKGLDMIVANGPESMGTVAARISILHRGGSVVRLPRLPKSKAAAEILNQIWRPA